jgi:ribosomal protein L30E
MTSPWERFGIEVSSKESRDNLLERIRAAMKQAKQVGLSVHHDVIYLGVNRTMKGIEKGRLHSVCIARDTPVQICKSVIEAAVLQNVKIIMYPKSVLEFTSAFGLKRVHLFGIRSSCVSKRSDKEAFSSFDTLSEEERMRSNELNSFHALMDKIRETARNS